MDTESDGGSHCSADEVKTESVPQTTRTEKSHRKTSSGDSSSIGSRGKTSHNVKSVSASSKSLRKAHVDSVKLLMITDAASGATLYEKHWSWKHDAQVQGVQSMIQSFFQFAREIDDGEVSRVSFETPSRGPSHRRLGSRDVSKLGGPRPRQRPAIESLHMLCCKSGPLLASVFIEPKESHSLDLGSQFASQTAHEFCLQFPDEIQTLSRDFKALSPQAPKTVPAEISNKFKDFDGTVERLHSSLFSPQSHLVDISRVETETSGIELTVSETSETEKG